MFTLTDNARLAYGVMARIPDGASVSTQSPFIPHLTNRRELYLFPYVHGAEYVLVDSGSSRWPLNTAEWNRTREELLASPVYALMYVEAGYELFKRTSPLPIQHPLSISFVDQFELIGVDTPAEAIRSGERFELALYWKPVTSIGARRGQDRVISSVTLLNEDGEAFTHVDKEFWDGVLTTDRLIHGEIHRERYELQAPDTPGIYRVVAGLSTVISNQPLAVYINGTRTERFTAQVATVRIAQ